MTPRPLLLTRLLTVLAAALACGLLYFVFPWALGRDMNAWEVVAAAAVLVVGFEWLRARLQHRAQQELDSLRDSALW